MSSKYRVGIIGCGKIVENVYFPLLSKMTNIVIDAIYDINEERLSAVKDKFQIKNSTNNIDGFFKIKLDIIFIFTPNCYHREHIIHALNRDLIIFCEKPFLLSTKELDEVVRQMNRSNGQVYAGYNNYFRTEVSVLNHLLQSKQISAVREIHCGWLRKNGIPGLGSWFTNKEKAGGGVLIDIGTHVIDIVLRLINYPGIRKIELLEFKLLNSEHSHHSWYNPTKGNLAVDVESRVKFKVLFENNVQATMEFSWENEIDQDVTFIKLYGEEDETVVLQTLFGFSPDGVRPTQPLIFRDKDLNITCYTGDVDPMLSYGRQLQWFFERIDNKYNFNQDIYSNYRLITLIETVYGAINQKLHSNGG
jgi:predicted dehydrogenase